MLPAKLPSKQLQVIWYSVINSIIHQWWSGKCYCLLPKYLYLTRTWLKKYLLYLMSSKYSEYLNLYLYLQIWKSTCTWLKYFEKYLTPTLLPTKVRLILETWRYVGKYSDSSGKKNGLLVHPDMSGKWGSCNHLGPFSISVLELSLRVKI